MDETSYINELIVNNNKEFLETKDIPKIQKSICLFKYYDEKNNKIVGTGFFLKFRYEDKYMHILLTSNHVRKIENYDNFIYYFQENKKKSLPLKNRIKCQSGKNELDYTCIQILNEDKITNFLNIDDNALNETYPWEGKQIYIYNYEFKLSWGKIVKKKNNEANSIYYDCNTESGFSGGPILDKNNSVIGIHKGAISKDKINFGRKIKYFKYIIDDIKHNLEKLNEKEKKL